MIERKTFRQGIFTWIPFVSALFLIGWGATINHTVFQSGGTSNAPAQSKRISDAAFIRLTTVSGLFHGKDKLILKPDAATGDGAVCET